MHRRKHLIALVAVLVTALAGTSMQATAIAPGTSPFSDTWARTDQPVASGAASRTWMWGPSGFSSAMMEQYSATPGGFRVVQYYDKTRMEITHPEAVNDGVWYVTNGLLARELITGKLQLGDNDFVDKAPAQVNIAGDADDANGPTYASFSGLLSTLQGDPNATLTTRVHRDGTTADEPGLAGYGIKSSQYVIETNHRIADPFWAFMNAQGTVYKHGQFVNENLFANSYYATGFPITDPYWARVKVGGTEKDVLVQAFERRVLTYTPDNAPEWRVEAGNVGQHYYKWRYNTDIPSEPAASDSNANPMGPSPLQQWPINNGGQAYVEIGNQSPYPLTLTLDGPTTYSLTVAACPSCVVYANESQFTSCRDDITWEHILLPAGNYRVTTAHQGGNVNPGDGPWTLVPDGNHVECIGVVQQPVTNSTGALSADGSLAPPAAAIGHPR